MKKAGIYQRASRKKIFLKVAIWIVDLSRSLVILSTDSPMKIKERYSCTPEYYYVLRSNDKIEGNV